LVELFLGKTRVPLLSYASAILPPAGDPNFAVFVSLSLKSLLQGSGQLCTD